MTISFDILRKMIRYPRALKSLCNYLKLFDSRYIRHTQLSARRCRYGTSKIYLSSKSPLLSCEKNQQLPWIQLVRVGTQARSEAALRYFRARVSFKVSRVILKCTVYNDSGVLHDFGSLWKSSKTKRHEKIIIRRKIRDYDDIIRKKIFQQYAITDELKEFILRKPIFNFQNYGYMRLDFLFLSTLIYTIVMFEWFFSFVK